MKALYIALGRKLSDYDAGLTHTTGIARALAAAGVEVTIAVSGAGKAPEGVRCIEVSWTRTAAILGGGKVFSVLAKEAAAADIIQERAEESGGVGVRLARATGKPLVLEINTPISGHRRRFVRPIADWNLRRQARAADAVITQTSISKAIIEGYTPTDVYVVPNGADGEAFSPERAAVEIRGAAGRRVIAFAGSLRPWHGVEDLIEAGRRILERHREAFFLFVGGGERLLRLQAKARRELGEPNCLFTGAVRPEEVPGHLAAAEVLVAPFAPERDHVRRSQFGRYGMWWSPVKIFEYMAMGKPIVASEAGCVGEYLAGTGVTCPPGEAEALAQAVCRLLEDEAKARELGRTARERFLANYTWGHAAQGTIAAWREVEERF